MDLTRLLFPVCGVFCSTLWFAGVVGFVCQSPQYIEIKSTGKVDCLFPESLHNLFWYNTTDVFHEEAVVTLLDSVKSGQGFLSGEFDIDPNGALIINNVTLEHEGTYTAIVLERPSSIVIRYTVNVSVVAPAFIPWPRISRCNNASEICFQILDRHSEISCFIQDARPAVPLMWIVRTNSGDLNISSHLSVSNKSFSFFTSRVTTTNPFVYTSRFVLLVCKATSPPGLLENYESFVLIQNSEIVFPASPVKKYVDIKGKLELNCTDNQMGYLVWQRLHHSESIFRNVVVAVLSGGNLQTQIGEDDFTVKASGMLVANDVKTHHEGVYRCISGNGLEDGVVVYEVTVFALPVPAYLVVDGCDHQQHCVLEAQPEGQLHCSVRGIRPEVNIEFRPLHEKTLASVQFYDNELTIQNSGDVLDISLISKYRLNDATQSRITIQCRVIETDIHLLLLSTNFDLIVKGKMTSTEKNFHNTKDESEGKRYSWTVAIVLAVLLLLLLLYITIYKLKAHHERQQRNNLRVFSEEDTLVMPLRGGQGKRKMFISELKARYENLCNAIQPVPYIRDRLYSVNKVFVEGGIEFLVENTGDTGTWKKLNSHQDILNDTRLKSSRWILEGEPGYGKSTLTLRLAYDWCNKIDGCMKDTDIFILLRLRQYRRDMSIFSAIRNFLLPKDSCLTPSDIKNIMSHTSSVVVVLDGFDEYPDREKDTNSDVYSIIAREMFLHFDVILTTRSSCLPNNYPPLTRRTRLTGFDNDAQEEYIQKAVVGDDTDAVKKTLGQLKTNPILEGLCQMPLLFAMFAHMSYELKSFQKCNSVTKCFVYMISCFHSHMKNKMKDRNVTQYNLQENEHNKLDKVAFDGLCGKDAQPVWEKSYLLERLGDDLYNQYVRIGILVEEEVLKISSNWPMSDHIQCKTEVRFYHKLFCEWYAAHYLAECASENTGFENLKCNASTPKTKTDELDNFLYNTDPLDLQYVYRFACGLSSKASENIVGHLKQRKETQNLAILCVLEQEEIFDKGLKDIKELCSRDIHLNTNDNLFLQMSTILFLKVASSNQIPTSSIYLTNCYLRFDLSMRHIQLKSNFTIPVLPTLEKLWIEENGKEMSQEDIIYILKYSAMCSALRELWFYRCLLPRFISVESLMDLKSRKFQVFWGTGSKANYSLNLKTGVWQRPPMYGGAEMTDEDYNRAIMSQTNLQRSLYSD